MVTLSCEFLLVFFFFLPVKWREKVSWGNLRVARTASFSPVVANGCICFAFQSSCESFISVKAGCKRPPNLWFLYCVSPGETITWVL